MAVLAHGVPASLGSLSLRHCTVLTPATAASHADKHASYIFISLMIGVLFHHIALLWRQEGVLLNGMVAVMLLHVTGECCFSYCISKHVKVYIEHRTWFVMVARMSFQACMLFYVPRYELMRRERPESSSNACRVIVVWRQQCLLSMSHVRDLPQPQ